MSQATYQVEVRIPRWRLCAFIAWAFLCELRHIPVRSWPAAVVAVGRTMWRLP